MVHFRAPQALAEGRVNEVPVGSSIDRRKLSAAVGDWTGRIEDACAPVVAETEALLRARVGARLTACGDRVLPLGTRNFRKTMSFPVRIGQADPAGDIVAAIDDLVALVDRELGEDAAIVFVAVAPGFAGCRTSPAEEFKDGSDFPRFAVSLVLDLKLYAQPRRQPDGAAL